MFILSHNTNYFFVKKFICLNDDISVNTIFGCLYMFFGWARHHELSTDAASGELAKAIQNAYSRIKGDLSVQKLGISYQS